DPLYKQRADLLLRIGLEIFFVKDVSEFLNGCQQGRPGTIIVDTLPHSDETIQIINLIAKTPELSAARCVLNLTRPAPSACKASMSAHFREVIPWSIDSTIWVQRLSQAVSAKSVEGPIEACSVTMNHPAVLRVSARVIWMNETHVRLESRGAYRLGSTMHVTGPVAAAMGAQHISLVVESIHKNRLVYRYSQAIIAKWGVPIDLLERARALVRTQS
ncbi:MAG: hypothetical protein NTV34_04680, partial [Proteobacteria bacterium]|nr:hypothetical protein [Pseudomonadota bacterium]